MGLLSRLHFNNWAIANPVDGSQGNGTTTIWNHLPVAQLQVEGWPTPLQFPLLPSKDEFQFKASNHGNRDNHPIAHYNGHVSLSAPVPIWQTTYELIIAIRQHRRRQLEIHV